MKLNAPDTWSRRLRINLALAYYYCLSRVFLVWFWFTSPPKGQIWVADKVEDEEDDLAIIPPQTWDEWLDEHIQVCETCRVSFTENANTGMCRVAFEKFKEFLKKAKEGASVPPT